MSGVSKPTATATAATAVASTDGGAGSGAGSGAGPAAAVATERDKLYLDTDWMKGMKSALVASRTELILPLIDLILLYATPPFLVALHPLLSALKPLVRTTVLKARDDKKDGPMHDVISKFAFSTADSFRDWLLTDAPERYEPWKTENGGTEYRRPPVEFLTPAALMTLWDEEMANRSAVAPELAAPIRRCAQLIRQFIVLCGGETRVRIATIRYGEDATAPLEPIGTKWTISTRHVWLELDDIAVATATVGGDAKQTEAAAALAAAKSIGFPVSAEEYARHAAGRWSLLSPMKDRIARTFGSSDDGLASGGSLRFTFERSTLIDAWCVIL